jgi:hypothetical protein
LTFTDLCGKIKNTAHYHFSEVSSPDEKNFSGVAEVMPLWIKITGYIAVEDAQHASKEAQGY